MSDAPEYPMEQLPDGSANIQADLDGDGRAETVNVQYVQFEDGTEGIGMDVNGDGEIDLVQVDENGDGELGEDEVYEVTG